ncbi:TetR/AcrR family transcriptional regulator [Agreia sp. VKM Ac-1783]|uniref:TetR/AcrR family transcriptional regulator n=1 Tax=Agreia sp. VKM Ac-1783 TaxID=1938889 RepID=UPI000A2AA50F|nr:TetR/AcrR family transcriptional regulator [Agreia sp. VKM Ac-1783]SMQ73686.1 transcriptional regulator, TetR family [Agreia sp. VKM Ac-1783]
MSGVVRRRNSETTRRAILGAAREVIRERGGGVALAEIAAAAGVSKSGLLHHFASRDALFLAVAEDIVEFTRSRMLNSIDSEDDSPGRVLRAYLRTALDARSAREWFDPTGLWASLHSAPGVPELLSEDERWLRERFAEDGLHPQRVLVISRAAEGLAVSSIWDDLSPEEYRLSYELLVALTMENGPLVT